MNVTLMQYHIDHVLNRVKNNLSQFSNISQIENLLWQLKVTDASEQIIRLCRNVGRYDILVGHIIT